LARTKIEIKTLRIKLFLKMSNYLETICLKCRNSKKVQKREKTKIGGKLGASCFKLVSLQSMYPIIDNILSYNLVEHYLSSFLQKEIINIYIKSLIMLVVQSPENLPKTLGKAAWVRHPPNTLWNFSKVVASIDQLLLFF